MFRTSITVFFLCFIISFTYSQVPFISKNDKNPNKQKIRKINLTAKLSDKKFVEQIRENTKRLYPESFSKMNKSDESENSNIGEKKIFWVYDNDKYSYYQLEATLMLKGNIANIWIDTTEMVNGHITAGDLNEMLKTLEIRTPKTSKDSLKGILSLNNQYFGYPPNINSQGVKGQGDGRIDFLVFDIKDGFDEVNNLSYAAGYFDPNDQRVISTSNRRDMLYIDTYPSIYYQGERDLTMAMQTMAHEFQHLIQYNYDPYEIIFITEACSMNAEIISGYNVFKDLSELDFFTNTNLYLFKWDSDNLPEDYCRAALWLLYIVEQTGDNFTKVLAQNGTSGINGVLYSLLNVSSSKTFSQLFINWNVANYINDKEFSSLYGYKYNVNGRAKGTILLDPNQSLSTLPVNALASRYIVFASSSQNFKYKFSSSSSEVDIKMVAVGKQTKTVQNVEKDVEYSEPGFAADYDTIVFVITNYGSQSADVSLTSSGEVIVKSEEITYDDGSPKIIDGVAYLYLPAIGDGWAVKFSPRYPQNKLNKIKMWLAFGQEFPNSGIPENAPKKFKVHIWSAGTDNMPGNEIIQPFIWIIPRTNELPTDFVSIDLNGLSSKLTNLQSPVFIGFTEDDEYYTEIGINNMNPVNHSYAYMAQTGWTPLEDMSVNGNTTKISLKGWNVMVRAQFNYETNGISRITDESPDYSINQNYPNPFNPETNIEYTIPAVCNVKICIYDVLGRKVRELINERQNKGKYIITWNGDNQRGSRVSSGIYFYRIEAGNFSQTKKMNLMK